jgi:hypothetical protein
VIPLAAVLLLVAVGLLAGGLAQGSAALQWGSFAASALAAVVLAVGELRRRRAADGAVGARKAEAAAVAAGRATAPPPAAGATRPPAAATESTGPSDSTAPAEPGEPGGSAEPTEPTELAEPTSGGPGHAVPATDHGTGPATDPATDPATGSHAARAASGPATGSHAAVVRPAAGSAAATPVLGADGEPPVEEVEVTDLLLVLDLRDEVLVVDEHPRYHLAGCPHLAGADTLPLPMDEARTDGFTPCGTCAPDRNLAERERARRSA